MHYVMIGVSDRYPNAWRPALGSVRRRTAGLQVIDQIKIRMPDDRSSGANVFSTADSSPALQPRLDCSPAVQRRTTVGSYPHCTSDICINLTSTPRLKDTRKHVSAKQTPYPESSTFTSSSPSRSGPGGAPGSFGTNDDGRRIHVRS